MIGQGRQKQLLIETIGQLQCLGQRNSRKRPIDKTNELQSSVIVIG